MMAGIFLLFLSAWFIQESSGALIITSHRNALLTFKSGMKTSSSVFGTWVAKNDCRLWTGVECDAKGYVLRLKLARYGLTGRITSQLGQITTLITLDLNNNKISGVIPKALGLCTKLVYINLSKNQLTGTIRTELGSLSALQQLILDFNQLNGAIPSSIKGMKGLLVFTATYNSLSGTIPTELGQLTKLRTIALDANFLQGSLPPSLGNLVQLQYLGLSVNKLTGPIPSTFGNMASMQTFILSGNSFSGNLPGSLAKMSKIQVFRVNNNKLTGNVPQFGAGFPAYALQTLDVSGNLLNGILPKNYTKLRSIVTINANGNQLTGGIHWSIGYLPYLKDLLLYNNKLTGVIPPALAKATNLVRIYLHTNKLYGSLPPLLANLPNLQELRVHQNQLAGTFPSNFLSPKLKYVDLRINYFTGIPNIYLNTVPYCKVKTLTVAVKYNCFDSSSSDDCSSADIQRSPTSCGLFCNVTSDVGPCGGFGSCFTSSDGSFECSCISGYNNDADPAKCSKTYPGYQGTQTRGLLPISTTPKFASTTFRYASTGYDARLDSWTVATSLNWASLKAVVGPKDQETCNSCWAFAPIAAIESSYFLTFGSLPLVSLAEQQVVDCTGVGNCAGGWPGDTLEYASRIPLVPTKHYPYIGIDGFRTCNSNQTVPNGLVKLSQYEVINFKGWFGLLLAVQQSPVVVNIEASEDSFVNYIPGQYVNDVYDDPFCFLKGLDHSVVIVGYNIENIDRPYWIIKNSWGTDWGLKGYMRMKITGGYGICGMNTLPGLMPIVPGRTPCNANSWGSGDNIFAGDLNPCGAGKCVVKGSSNICQNCPVGWVAVTNLDKSQTCAPAKPCTFFTYNPCGVGSCVDNTRDGTYTCICPLGYGKGQISSDNSQTCVISVRLEGVQYYTVPSGFSITCSVIYQIYGISKQKFFTQNRNLDCTKALPGGTVVNITKPDLKDCALPYAVNRADNCSAIAKKFNIPLLAGPNSPNPDLSCSSLQPGQQVCIKRGTLPEVPLCTNVYPVQPGDTCNTLIKTYFGGNWTDFYSLNPGLYCDRLAGNIEGSSSIPGEDVCLEATGVGRSSYKANCRRRKGFYFTVPAKARCATLLAKYYQRDMRVFKKYNNGARCLDVVMSRLRGKCLCAKNVPLAQRCAQ